MEELRAIVEVSEVLPMYLEHLSDPDMAQIYYFWNGSYYRLQTRFVDGSCIALIPGKGCTLKESRPSICRVWPFWWKEGLKPSTEEFPIEVNGECTMIISWNLPIEAVLRELGSSESMIRKELLALNKALEEHGKVLREAHERSVPPERLLDWLIEKIRRGKLSPGDLDDRTFRNGL